MKLTMSEAQQAEMRHAHYEGAPGVLVSGLVWMAATLVALRLGTHQAVWTLLIGGALIHPITTVLTRLIGRPGKTGSANALNQLAIASTIWLILCCAMAYGLFLFKPVLFFPAMMATIGSRYLVFASLFGRAIYWLLGASLIAAAIVCVLTAAAPLLAVFIGGTLELVFACLLMPRVASLISKKR